MHQHKSLLNGEKGTCLLTANQMSVLIKHHSADVVTICMLLQHQRYALHCLVTDVWVRVPRLALCGIGGTGRRKARGMLDPKKYTASIKMVKTLKLRLLTFFIAHGLNRGL
jgi:hypothetical protein